MKQHVFLVLYFFFVKLDFPGGGGFLQSPLGMEIPRGGGIKLKTLRGRGMDIFWNRTIYEAKVAK